MVDVVGPGTNRAEIRQDMPDLFRAAAMVRVRSMSATLLSYGVLLTGDPILAKVGTTHVAGTAVLLTAEGLISQRARTITAIGPTAITKLSV
jgi:hypothetical protein